LPSPPIHGALGIFFFIRQRFENHGLSSFFLPLNDTGYLSGKAVVEADIPKFRVTHPVM